jgi:glutamine---fructose-6-phosphate transaminase (isomerizing)
LNPFYTEIQQQPAALRQVISHYHVNDSILAGLHTPKRVLLIGMGASFHAALWASYLLQGRGIWAIAVEASDLLYFSGRLVHDVDRIIFISQSGASAEVLPVTDLLPESTELIGITNDLDSPLAQQAHIILPLVAGTETTVATKTYLNSLACLWLLCQQWYHGRQDEDYQSLLQVADATEGLLARSDDISTHWIEQLSPANPLYFLGHGPHITTARQAAMMLGEWAKHAAIGTSVGAFRHGLIEVVAPGTRVVLLGVGGMTDESIESLADDLRSYGATVIPVVEGRTVETTEEQVSAREFEELLSPLLDVIPTQLFAESMARHLGVVPGFRHIHKVVQQL